MRYIWIVSCEGKPVGAYNNENDANLFALRASGLMNVQGFTVVQVILYEEDSTGEQTVYTPPLVPDTVMTFCSQ